MQAQDRYLRVIVGFAAGGAADTVARAVAEGLPDAGYNAIVDNRIGAGGRLATEALLADPQGLHDAEAVVYSATARAGGSISAEHGIGLVKRPFLHLSRSPEELAVMRALKTLFDPAGILNAGRVLGR